MENTRFQNVSGGFYGGPSHNPRPAMQYLFDGSNANFPQPPAPPPFDIHNINIDSVKSLGDVNVVKLLNLLKTENDRLKMISPETSNSYDARLTEMERQLNIDRQYLRRDTIEISGMPNNIPEEKVEEEVIKVLKAANVKVGGKFPTPNNIQAAHYTLDNKRFETNDQTSEQAI